jgi:hypothetical protein
MNSMRIAWKGLAGIIERKKAGKKYRFNRAIGEGKVEMAMNYAGGAKA